MAEHGGDVAVSHAGRRRELGLDPKSKRYREREAQAAERLEEKTGPLRRDASGDADWIDVNGKTYDAVGPVPGEHFHADSFMRSIDSHLRKQGLDYVVVDTATLGPLQREAVERYIGGLTAAQRARIILQP